MPNFPMINFFEKLICSESLVLEHPQAFISPFVAPYNRVFVHKLGSSNSERVKGYNYYTCFAGQVSI